MANGQVKAWEIGNASFGQYSKTEAPGAMGEAPEAGLESEALGSSSCHLGSPGGGESALAGLLDKTDAWGTKFHPGSIRGLEYVRRQPGPIPGQVTKVAAAGLGN